MLLLLLLSSGFDKAGIYSISDIANEYSIHDFSIILTLFGLGFLSI